ncbi:mitochondrial carrier domain-containing protein, partial [Phlyctochytrium arcticum]
GFAMSLTFCIPATILYLCTYEAFRNNANFLGNPETSSLIHFIGGALAEIISNVFWCPMEVVKGRQQAAIKATPPPRTGYVDQSSNPSDMTTWGFCSDIFRRQGLTGFFVGFWFGILVYLPYSVIYFVFYEDFKNFFAGEKGQSSLSSLNIMLCSAAASAIAAAVTNLIDVPKTAYQVAKDQESNASLSFREYVTTMWQREGFWGFTRGMGARVAWMVPSTVIQFTIFEAVRSRFRQS